MGLIQRFAHGEIEAVRVGRFKGKINMSCILYRMGTTLIDTGPPNQWASVRRFLDERRPERVLLTHHHEDHGGNLSPIANAYGATLLAPEGSLTPLANGFPLKAYQKIIWGRPAMARPEVLPDRIAVGDGIELVPVATPGHSSDMTCFLEPQRGWLFSGDLYISRTTKYLRADESLGELLISLRRALALDFQTLFCAHRGVVTDGKAALRGKLENLEALCARVKSLHAEGRGLAEITRILCGREDVTAWLTGFHFTKKNLVRACIALSDAELAAR